MWGRKAKRIKALEYDLAEESRICQGLVAELGAQHDAVVTLTARCDSLAADLKVAQNALLVEADQNGIRAEAIAHVREVIAVAGMGLCSGCTANVHGYHTQESGCPVEGCVCLIRDSDPTGDAT